MKTRCLDRKSGNYQNYGARGIKVSDRWLNFMNFIADMGPRPFPKHSLDRIDNDGNYCKENCRWATTTEQNNNRRNTIYVILDGQRIPLGEAISKAALPDLPKSLIRERVHRGWDAEAALKTPRAEGTRTIGTPLRMSRETLSRVARCRSYLGLEPYAA